MGYFEQTCALSDIVNAEREVRNYKVRKIADWFAATVFVGLGLFFAIRYVDGTWRILGTGLLIALLAWAAWDTLLPQKDHYRVERVQSLIRLGGWRISGGKMLTHCYRIAIGYQMLNDDSQRRFSPVDSIKDAVLEKLFALPNGYGAKFQSLLEQMKKEFETTSGTSDDLDAIATAFSQLCGEVARGIRVDAFYVSLCASAHFYINGSAKLPRKPKDDYNYRRYGWELAFIETEINHRYKTERASEQMTLPAASA